MNHTARQPVGFTLIELMIAVAIVSILAAIAYPSYQNYVEGARRAGGQAKLMEVMAAQERFYSANNSYTANLTQLGYPASPVPSDGDWYRITADNCAGAANTTNCVLLTATPQRGQAADGNLGLDSRNNKTGNW